MIILLFLSLILGLGYICLGIKKHQLQAIPSKITNNNSMAIIIGYLIVAIVCVISIYYWGIGMGLVFYMVIFTLAHLSCILLITYKPKQLSFITGYRLLCYRAKINK